MAATKKRNRQLEETRHKGRGPSKRLSELLDLADQAASLADVDDERILFMAANRARVLRRTVVKDDLLWAKRVAGYIDEAGGATRALTEIHAPETGYLQAARWLREWNQLARFSGFQNRAVHNRILRSDTARCAKATGARASAGA